MTKAKREDVTGDAVPAAAAAFVRELAWALKYAGRTDAERVAYAVRELSSEERRATRAKVLKTLERPETHGAIRRLWAEQIDHAQLFFEGDVIGFLREMAQRIA